MHFEETPAKPLAADVDTRPWYADLTRYHWFVLIVAALGWLFDTMDQQLFALARVPAITELISPPAAEGAPTPTPEEKAAFAKKLGDYTGWATSIFMIGWALGGLAFGVLGDKIGRARTMLLTILFYSIFTGLSALSVGFADFCIYRFLTGLGVGGEFAVGVALVAEVMPSRARPFALGWVQALSAVGNMTAAVITIFLGKLQEGGYVGRSWRIMFVIGTLPAILAVLIRARLKEPEKWSNAEAEAEGSGSATNGKTKPLGSISELFGDPRWRRNTLVGMTLAFAGVVGLWGIGFFSSDLTRLVFKSELLARGYSEAAVDGQLYFWTGLVSLVQNFGSFLGVYAFSRWTAVVGRRPAFALCFVLAMVSTAFTFLFLGRIGGFLDVFWMMPIMGFCQLTLFGGYAIYFPELFPTRLRSTGTSFCYNVGRLVAAAGPAMLSMLRAAYAGYGVTQPAMPLRLAGVTMCAVFLIGLAALPFAPETRGEPLPE